MMAVMYLLQLFAFSLIPDIPVSRTIFALTLIYCRVTAIIRVSKNKGYIVFKQQV